MYHNIFYIAFLHWIFDFLCQNQTMATEKSKNNNWLLIHCLIYGLLAFCYFPIASLQIRINFYIVLVVSHFFIDYLTSRLNSYLWKQNEVHWFFVSVGFDQLLHLGIILAYLHFHEFII